LSTLAAFLRTSLSPVASTSTAPPPWYLAASFDSPRAYSSFLSSFGSNTSSRFVVDVSSETRSAPIEPFSLALSTPSDDLSLSTFSLYTTTTTTGFSSGPAASTSAGAGSPQTLLSLLHPTLLSSFLDAAPTAFSPTPVLGQSSQTASAELQTITAVLRVARELFYRDLGGNHSSTSTEEVGGNLSMRESGSGGGQVKKSSKVQARKLLFSLLNHSAPYFPFGQDELQVRASAEEEQLLQLNLIFAELVSLLVLSEEEEEAEEDSNNQFVNSNNNQRKNNRKQTSNKLDKTDSKNKLNLILSTVQTWVISALECSLVSTSHPLGLPPLSFESFLALEPTLWSLLNRNQNSQRGGRGGGNNREEEGGGGVENVWKAILKSFNKMGKESEARRRVFEFISRSILIQSDPSYTNRFDLESQSQPPSSRGGGTKPREEGLEETMQWCQGLGKWLWELGTKQIDTTEVRIVVAPFFLSWGNPNPRRLT